MQIVLSCGNASVFAITANTDAARSFLLQLPIELEVSDFAGAEKIAYLPVKLEVSSDDKSTRAAGAAGEIAYYVPWGNLAMFYKPFNYGSDLVRIGLIEGDGVAFLKALSDGSVLRISAT